MTNAIDQILIVGGGTAGWLTAAILAKTQGPAGVRVTVIESSDIPTVGVGEGTFPTIARTLASLGVDEAEFMRESGAAFKQGIRFVDWARTPEAGRHSHYYHPFALPRGKDLDLLPYWLSGEAGVGVSFAEAVTLQEKVCDAGRAPKRVTDAQFRGPMNYAYHLDAARFGAYLRKVATSMGVRHVAGTVDRVELDQGAICAVTTREHGRHTADLYIDCTGFRSELLGRAMGVPFNDKNDILFVDRAVTVQVPHGLDAPSIPPYTISTAHEAGWTWDIALAHRRGVGYVYSSRHADDERAEAVLRGYVGHAAAGLEVRHLKLQVGWRQQHWVQNCVAVGLSGGFLEPLESTGIILIEAAAFQLSRLLQPGCDLARVASQFNERMTRRYERIVDFIKLHYFLTQRSDSDFWRENALPETAPASLLAHLEIWRDRPPSPFDFAMEDESFAPGNYQFVLYGMGFRTAARRADQRDPCAALARQEFARVREASKRAVTALPAHRELLERVYQAGFSFADMSRFPGATSQ